MGIRLLNKLLGLKSSFKAIRSVHMRDLRNKKVVIDTHNYLYRFKGEGKLVEQIFTMCSLFRYYNITPIFVFDGKPPIEKQKTIQDRRETKQQNYLKYTKLLSNNTYIEKSQLNKMRRGFTTMNLGEIDEVKALLAAYGILYIQAQGESDPLCVELVKTRIAYACMSDDMDMVAYGCPRVLRHFNLVKRNMICYDYEKILKDLNDISPSEFLTLCILAGTDYGQFEKNIFMWYDNYRAYKDLKSSPFEEFLDYLCSTNNLSIDDRKRIERITLLFSTKNTLCNYPYRNFRLYPIQWRKLDRILRKNNFLLSTFHKRKVFE